MQIVIDIPEEIKDFISGKNIVSDDTACDYLYELRKSVNNGIVLPKGHGDLIDRSELYNQTANWESQALEQVNKYDPMYTRDDWRWWTAVLKERGAFKHDVADAKTIISADKEDEK